MPSSSACARRPRTSVAGSKARRALARPALLGSTPGCARPRAWLCRDTTRGHGIPHHACRPGMRTSPSRAPDGGVAASAGAMADRRERRAAADGSPPVPGAASPFTVISPLGRCRPGSAAVAKALAALPAVHEGPSEPPAGSRASARPVEPPCTWHDNRCVMPYGAAMRACSRESQDGMTSLCSSQAATHLQPADPTSPAAWPPPPRGASRSRPTSAGPDADPRHPAPAPVLPVCKFDARDEVLRS